MKILLLKDVYKLGRAGEVKKVAPGYGRNYLIPQGLAVMATPGAIIKAEKIKEEADKQRAVLNKEYGVFAEHLEGQRLVFAVRASETGRLYGSVTSRMIADRINEEFEIEISPRDVDTQPLRQLGEHTIPIRLTMDLVPEVQILLHREGESAEEGAEGVVEAEAATAEAEVETSAEGGAVEEEASDEVEGEVQEEKKGLDIEAEADSEVSLEAESAEGGEASEEVEEEIKE